MDEAQAHFVTSVVRELVSHNGKVNLTSRVVCSVSLGPALVGRAKFIRERLDQKENPDQTVSNGAWSYQTRQDNSLWGSFGSAFCVCCSLSIHAALTQLICLPTFSATLCPAHHITQTLAKARQMWSTRTSSFVPLLSPYLG